MNHIQLIFWWYSVDHSKIIHWTFQIFLLFLTVILESILIAHDMYLRWQIPLVASAFFNWQSMKCSQSGNLQDGIVWVTKMLMITVPVGMYAMIHHNRVLQVSSYCSLALRKSRWWFEIKPQLSHEIRQNQILLQISGDSKTNKVR